MAKQNVIKNLLNKIQAKDVIVPTGTKQGKTLTKYLEEINKEIYSNEEFKTNKIFFGKPVYRKAFLLDGVNNTGKVYSDVVTGIDGNNVISITGGGRGIGGEFYAFGYSSNPTSGYFSIQLNTNNFFYVGTSYNLSNIIAIVEYTK